MYPVSAQNPDKRAHPKPTGGAVFVPVLADREMNDTLHWMEMLLPDELVESSSRKSGNEEALGAWVTALYTELRRLAAHYMEGERENHTLQTTALVHEAYLRLVEQREVQWESKSQVIGIAAQMMRRILLDYSRGQRSAKRGGKVRKIYLQEASLVSKDRTADVLAVDEALTRLEAVDPQHARVVELRFFGGLSVDETAGVLAVSPATVKRNWNVAKAWLARELKTG